jgi:hypothetical protein
MSARAKSALEHYVPILEELKKPTTHRLTIEVFGLDPGTDLTKATLEFSPHRKYGEARACRFVTTTDERGRARVVGLWRIVPESNHDRDEDLELTRAERIRALLAIPLCAIALALMWLGYRFSVVACLIEGVPPPDEGSYR